jgi:hypothetical protein
MALSKDQRITISKKIIDIPIANASIDGNKAKIEEQKVQVQNEDEGNRALQDDVTALINPYQTEYNNIDNNQRNELLEQDLINSANKTNQNFFFPNDETVPLPNIPDGIWKFFPPFANTKAVGRTYTETFSQSRGEQVVIADMNALISQIEGYPQVERVSGRQCETVDNGSCAGESPPGSGVDQITCVTNGGVWTPLLTGQKSPADSVADLAQLITYINEWKGFLNNQKSALQTVNGIDTNTSRVAENNTAIADIDNAIAEIDSWLAFPDFDNRSLPNDCDDIYDLDETDFDDVKLTTTILQTIKDEIAARTSFLGTRTGQLDTYLGSINQDYNTGTVAGGTGLYFERYSVIDIRLNLLGGSLNKLLSLDKGAAAQDAIKATNDNAAGVYASKLKVSRFKAPASNTGTLHLLSAADFTVGDSIYVVADKQEELTGNIVSINGDTVVVDFNVPEKYTHANSGRLYKTL